MAVKYTKEQLDLAVSLATRGETIGYIIEALCTDEFSFWLYKQENPEFLNTFEHARREGLEHIADNMRNVAKNETDVQRARLITDVDKWLLSKRNPQIYGDKIDLNVNQTVDIKLALEEAKQRLVGPDILQIPKKTEDT